ncbi:MAG: phospholipid carrier-dependent glycosyltransferase [Chloroflexi bacterium]|nr:phospholipid carrier-dependent glycosyltransferase [Chloroflexota bacterium]
MELPGQLLVDMETVRRWLKRAGRWEYLWPCLLVLVTLAVHLSIIMWPAQPVLDELYYLDDARSIIAGNGTLRAEHPPLAKLIITSGILSFGDNPFGWRFFSVIFGTASIMLFYLVCRRLGMSPRASSLATFLLALENLSFVMSSVAMLDVYSLTFMLASFWLYLKGQYLPSGVSIALAMLTKLTGVLAVAPILLHWLLARRAQPVKFALSMLVAYASFFLLLPLFEFVISGKFLNPLQQLAQALSLSGAVTFANATHPAATRPWDWVLRPEIMFFWYEPHYIAAISFTLWALIIPAVLYMSFRVARGNDACLFALSWFAGTYLVWIPASLITNRMSYVYYFYPTVGAVAIGLGLGLSRLIDVWMARPEGKRGRVAISGVVAFLVLHASVFAILSPLSTWWSAPY